MTVLNAKSADKFGYDNMRGQSVKNVGKPREGTDALTWKIPHFTTAERDLIPEPEGVIIYNTTTSKYQGYTTTWVDLH